ncbi:MAG TPA: hypothetical protein VIX14_03565, partial [Terriglobales bacterium]
AAPKPTASLFGQRGVSSRRQRRARVGTLTDVSLHGCYLEMNTTFPVGTKVKLVLKSFGVRV